MDAAIIKTEPNPTNETAYMRNGKAAMAAAPLSKETVASAWYE